MHIVDALLDGDAFRIPFQQDANVILDGSKPGCGGLRLKIGVIRKSDLHRRVSVVSGVVAIQSNSE
jgi:hypothetical protein